MYAPNTYEITLDTHALQLPVARGIEFTGSQANALVESYEDRLTMRWETHLEAGVALQAAYDLVQKPESDDQAIIYLSSLRNRIEPSQAAPRIATEALPRTADNGETTRTISAVVAECGKYTVGWALIDSKDEPDTTRRMMVLDVPRLNSNRVDRLVDKTIKRDQRGAMHSAIARAVESAYGEPN